MSEESIFDASHQILGRFSSKVAGELLDGKEVNVTNVNKLIITGKPKNIIDKYRRRVRRGDPHHGPYYPKGPKGIFRRTVRGMVPHKKKKGRDALARLEISNHGDSSENGIAKSRDDITCQHISLGELSSRLKGE